MNKKAKIMYIVLFVFFAAVFVVSALVVVDYVIESKRQADVFNELAGLVSDALSTEPDATEKNNSNLPSFPSDFVVGPDETQPLEILPEYQALYEQNPDLVGWINIPDTNVNYPVMQTPGNKDYYLKRDFYHNWSEWGCIYAREACDINKPSDNVVLYGHHMADGSMFAQLETRYKRQSFWEEHQYLTFDTLYEHHTYQIIACFRTSANVGQGFPYHMFNEADNEEEFNEFIAEVKRLALYDTGLTAEYGDKLLTLSTCEYTLDNGRFVVVAKRIS